MSEWKIACDRPGCTAHVRAHAPLPGLYAYAEELGWQLEPAIAPLRHFCPEHHVTEQHLERPCAAGIRRSP